MTEGEKIAVLEAELKEEKAAHMADLIGQEHALGTRIEQLEMENAGLRFCIVLGIKDDDPEIAQTAKEVFTQMERMIRRLHKRQKKCSPK